MGCSNALKEVHDKLQQHCQRSVATHLQLAFLRSSQASCFVEGSARFMSSEVFAHRAKLSSVKRSAANGSEFGFLPIVKLLGRPKNDYCICRKRKGIMGVTFHAPTVSYQSIVRSVENIRRRQSFSLDSGRYYFLHTTYLSCHLPSGEYSLLQTDTCSSA